MNTLALISLFTLCVIVANGQACGSWGGCSGGLCCSKWGYCGNTGDHCGAGCQSGSCWGAPPSNPPPAASGNMRCGSNWEAASKSCGGGCSNDGNCPAGQHCYKDLPTCGGSPPPSNPPPSNPPPATSSRTRCGSNWENANNGCGKACGNNNDCPGGQSCFKDLKDCSGGQPSNPPSNPPSGPIPSGSGSVSALINQNDFNRALSSCGINKPNLYNEMLRGFTAPLPGGLKELALLMGNMAHESGYFNYVEEIRCAGVNFVTGDCPYGLYHGRGYIQLSWDYNYREAANYLNNQRIFTDPNIVMNDPTVNWQTVQWFWVSRVQDTFRRRGYTMGASVRAINGGIECDNGPISPQRVQLIQCFERAYGVPVDSSTSCPAAALGDNQSVFSEQSQSQQAPLPTTFVIALVVLGVITLVLGVIVIVILVLLGKRMRSEEHV